MANCSIKYFKNELNSILGTKDVPIELMNEFKKNIVGMKNIGSIYTGLSKSDSDLISSSDSIIAFSSHDDLKSEVVAYTPHMNELNPDTIVSLLMADSTTTDEIGKFIPKAISILNSGSTIRLSKSSPYKNISKLLSDNSVDVVENERNGAIEFSLYKSIPIQENVTISPFVMSIDEAVDFQNTLIESYEESNSEIMEISDLINNLEVDSFDEQTLKAIKKTFSSLSRSIESDLHFIEKQKANKDSMKSIAGSKKYKKEYIKKSKSRLESMNRKLNKLVNKGEDSDVSLIEEIRKNIDKMIIRTAKYESLDNKSQSLMAVYSAIRDKIFSIIQSIRKSLSNMSSKNKKLDRLRSIISNFNEFNQFTEEDIKELKNDFRINRSSVRDVATAKAYQFLSKTISNFEKAFSPKYNEHTYFVSKLNKSYSEVVDLMNNVSRSNIEEKDVKVFRDFKKMISKTKYSSKYASKTTISDDGTIVKGGNEWIDMSSLFTSSSGKFSNLYEHALSYGLMNIVSTWDASTRILSKKEFHEIASDLGVDTSSAMKIKSLMEQGYSPIPALISSTVLDSVSVMSGIKGNKNANSINNELLNSMMESDLREMIKMNPNMFTSYSESFGHKTINFVKISSIENKSDIDESYRNISYMNPLKVVTDANIEPHTPSATIKHATTPLSQTDTDTLIRAGSIPWSLDTDELSTLISDYNNEETRISVMKSFGYVDIDSLPIYKQSKQSSTNNSIEREMDVLVKYYNLHGDTPLFLKYEITKPRRNTVSSDLNPVDSLIHREYLHKEVYRSEIDVSIEPVAPEDSYKSKNYSDIEMLEVALSQGLDLDPDKKTTLAIFTEFRELFNIYDSKNIMTDAGKYKFPMMAAYIETGKGKYEAYEEAYFNGGKVHGVKAVETLFRLSRHNISEPFVHHMTIESDAITSGSALLSLVSLSEKSVERLAKAGIYIGDKKEKWESYIKKFLSIKYPNVDKDDFVLDAGSLIEAGDFHYRNKDKYTEEVFADIYTGVGEKAYKESNRHFADNGSKYSNEVRSIVLGGENITRKEMRSATKDPVMTFNYGSLISTIKKNLAIKTVYNQFVERMEDTSIDAYEDPIIKAVLSELYSHNNKDESKDYTEDNLIRFLNDKSNFLYFDKESNSYRTQHKKDGLPNNDINFQRKMISGIASEEIIRASQRISDDIIGNPMSVAFDSEFQDITTYRDTLKSVEFGISSLFRIILDKEKQYLVNENGNITKEDVFDLINKLDKLNLGHSLNITRGTQSFLNTSKTGTSSSVRSQMTDSRGNSFSDSGSQSKVFDTEFVSNSGSFATITIHALDGDIMARALESNDFSSIYDAIIVSASHEAIEDSTGAYNSNIINSVSNTRILKTAIDKLAHMSKIAEEEYLVTPSLVAKQYRSLNLVKDDFRIFNNPSDKSILFKNISSDPSKNFRGSLMFRNKFINEVSFSNDGESKYIKINSKLNVSDQTPISSLKIRKSKNGFGYDVELLSDTSSFFVNSSGEQASLNKSKFNNKKFSHSKVTLSNVNIPIMDNINSSGMLSEENISDLISTIGEYIKDDNNSNARESISNTSMPTDYLASTDDNFYVSKRSGEHYGSSSFLGLQKLDSVDTLDSNIDALNRSQEWSRNNLSGEKVELSHLFVGSTPVINDTIPSSITGEKYEIPNLIKESMLIASLSDFNAGKQHNKSLINKAILSATNDNHISLLRLIDSENEKSSSDLAFPEMNKLVIKELMDSNFIPTLNKDDLYSINKMSRNLITLRKTGESSVASKSSLEKNNFEEEMKSVELPSIKKDC